MSAQPVDKNNKGFQTIFSGTSQKITTSGSSQQSSAFGSRTQVLRIFATEDCFVEFGSNPTATSSCMFLPGGIIDFIGVRPGEKLAVIQDSTSGSIYITEAGDGGS